MSNELKDRPLRWGIIGCGSICYDFCVALLTLPQDKHCLEHVAARDAGRAAEFAKKLSIKKSCGDYKKVFEDPNVDVVYIGTITPTHKDLSILAMNHGKHVLCEKPVTMNSMEFDEVLTCAKKCNTFFMEAMWTRCFPVYQEVNTKLNSATYGTPGVVLATFGLSSLFIYPRICTPEMGGSILRDIGIYAVSIADLIFGKYQLKEIKACGHIDEKTGIDRSVGITLTYEGNRIAHLMASGDHDLPNECSIICSKGKVTIADPFWCPEKYTDEIEDGIKQEYPFPLPKHHQLSTNFKNSVGLRYV